MALLVRELILISEFVCIRFLLSRQPMIIYLKLCHTPGLFVYYLILLPFTDRVLVISAPFLSSSAISLRFIIIVSLSVSHTNDMQNNH